MNESLFRLLDRIVELPEEWHGSGSVSPRVLRAIASHAERIGPIEHTVETGSGKTTLLFSHLSADHLAFAADHGESITKVRNSPLFRSEAVTYVEGFTQQTLPRHTFAHKVQIALIDGPHGYPFPDLEYYYLYPVIATGGLLLIDDIQIPTIGRMYEIIKAENMFRLDEVVDYTAFFYRTEAPLLDPFGDGWWLQGYNLPYYEQLLHPPPASQPPSGLQRAVQAVRRVVPKPLRKLVPERLKKMLQGW
jgi:hypothetical protein